MYGLEDEIPLRVCDSSLFLGVTAPKHVYDALFAFGDRAYHGVGEGFPAAARMRRRFVCADGQHGVQEQYSLLGPAVEVARRGRGRPSVVGDLLEDILQRGRERHAVAYREAEPVGLSGTVVGVLTDDDHFQLVERAFVEGAEDVAAARIDAPRGVFLPYELREVGEVGFFEFGSEQLFPVGGDLYIHVARWLKWCKCSKKSANSSCFRCRYKERGFVFCALPADCGVRGCGKTAEGGRDADLYDRRRLGAGAGLDAGDRGRLRAEGIRPCAGRGPDSDPPADNRVPDSAAA